jgi:hypothetical protein
LKIGDACAVRHNKKWCRAMVEYVNGDEILIFLVDYGHRQNVLKNCLRQLPACFMKFPAQAIKCHLEGIINTQSPSSKFWYPDILKPIRELVGKNGEIHIKSRRIGGVGRIPHQTELSLNVIL